MAQLLWLIMSNDLENSASINSKKTKIAIIIGVLVLILGSLLLVMRYRTLAAASGKDESIKKIFEDNPKEGNVRNSSQEDGYINSFAGMDDIFASNALYGNYFEPPQYYNNFQTGMADYYFDYTSLGQTTTSSSTSSNQSDGSFQKL